MPISITTPALSPTMEEGELNAALKNQGVKPSVNDLIVKALSKALVEVPLGLVA